jgi:hypothetical protein
MNRQTIYLLRESSKTGDDRGMILGAFYSKKEAVDWLIGVSEIKLEWFDCIDHEGMWDCISSAYSDEDEGFVITTCELYK